MKQYIYYICNPDRKNLFATETAIYVDKAGKKVVKSALFTEGESHIANMQSNYGSLTKIPALKKQVSVLPIGDSSPSSVTFEYIQGKNAERLLVEQLMSGDVKAMLSTISKLIAVVESLPSVNTNPTSSSGFKKVFGTSYNKKQDCTSVGLVDLNLDNFIVDDKGKWHLFDYEWLFDFAIPKQYLIQRFLFWFFLVRYKDLAVLRGNRLSLVELGPKLFVPTAVYDEYKTHFDSMDQLIDAEWEFQNYVNAFPRKITEGQNKFDIKLHRDAVAVKPEDIYKLSREQNLVRQYEAVSADHADLIQKYQRLEHEINVIRASRPYKLSMKAKGIKKRLIKPDKNSYGGS